MGGLHCADLCQYDAMLSACVSGKWRTACRVLCLTVSFPVGIGSSLLPCPMVILPAESQGEPLRAETPKKKQKMVFFLFPTTGGCDKMQAIWQRLI